MTYPRTPHNRRTASVQHVILAGLTLLAGLGLTGPGLAQVPAQSAVPARPASPAAMPSAPPTSAFSTRPMDTVSSLGIGNRNRNITDELECLLEPNMAASLGTQVPGIIAEVLVDRGDVVSAGQVVARLQSGAEQASVELKRAQTDYGQRRVKRNEELVAQQLLSESERDEVETQTRLAAIELKQQEAVLAQRVIRAPFSGVVVERMLNPGDRVYEEKILRIAQIDPLRVEVVVPARWMDKVHKGMRAEVSLAPQQSGKYPARVVLVDRVVDAATATVGVRLQLANPRMAIPAGLRCNVRFVSGGSRE